MSWTPFNQSPPPPNNAGNQNSQQVPSAPHPPQNQWNQPPPANAQPQYSPNHNTNYQQPNYPVAENPQTPPTQYPQNYQQNINQPPTTATSSVASPPPQPQTQPQIMTQPPSVTDYQQANHYPQQIPTDHQTQPQQSMSSQEEDWFSSEKVEGQLAVDVYQTTNSIVIKAPIAGVAPQDIDISLTDDVLTIKGKRSREEKIQPDDYFCQECYYGVFSRSIILPTAVATDQSDAAFINGVLTITIPKSDKAKTKKLAVGSH